jgi:hypothetical protein
MSESEMQAELERLRAENAQLKSKQGRPQFEGERERWGLPLRYGPVSGHALQRAMAPHPGDGQASITLRIPEWLAVQR